MDCISVAFFRSELYKFNVFDTVYIQNIDSLTTQGSVAGVFILRPTDDNIAALTQMLSNPPFDKIYVCMLYLPRLH